MDNQLLIKNLSKSFGSTHVLSEINLSIPLGAFTSILGPSGSGKTTLLMVLAGIEKATKGRIIFGNEDITDIALPNRKAGIVFQHYALFPNLTVRDNILYGVSSKVDQRIKEEKLAHLLSLTHLEELQNRYPHELSGGQKQRVAIARALAINPRFLLLDEPLSALDAQNRLTIGRELREIQQKAGITTVMVTHDRNEALSLSDFIVIIHNGKVEQAGTPQAIFDHPASPFVATFAGGMNLIRVPAINNGKLTGIRHSDVEVFEATERSLSEALTFTAELLAKEFSGESVLAHFLLNDFKTKISARIPRTSPLADSLSIGELYAVRLPQERWHTWEQV